MKKLNEIFSISYWTKFDFNKMEICEKNDNDWINFVSRTSQNNWIVAKVKTIKDKRALKKWQITVSLWGSYVLSAFLQLEDFYTGQNIAVLDPIEKLSERELFYYCMCITKNRFRYWAFWREANSSLKNLLVPSKEKIPSFIYESKIPNYSDIKDKLNNEKLSIDSLKWNYFEYSELFYLEKWKWPSSNFAQENSWKTPFISATRENNWVSYLVDYNAKHKWNVITVPSNWNSVWEAYFQENEFCSTWDVNILIPKFKLNKYIWIFISTMIRKDKYRYNYWRKWWLDKMRTSKIKLPINNSWKPDFEFMENYVKSLPYSKYL